MHKRKKLASVTIIAFAVIWLGAGSQCISAAGGQGKKAAPSQPGASKEEVDTVVHDAETQMRQRLTDYTDRVSKIEFSNLKPGQNHQGVHDNILNGYNGALKAMTRDLNEADAKISKLHPAAGVKNNSVKTLQTSFMSNAHTLRSRYDDAMRKFNAATRAHSGK